MEEFVNEVIKETLNMWQGDVVVINGRPRYSQSQGLVEKGNHLVELQLQAMKSEWKGRGSIPWSDWIPQVKIHVAYVIISCTLILDNLNTQLSDFVDTDLYMIIIINLVWLLTCSFMRSVYKQYRHIPNINFILQVYTCKQ